MARELPIQNGRLTTDLDANGFKIKNLPPGSGFTQAQADWNQTDSSAVDFIKNKPTIPAAVQVVAPSTDPADAGKAADAKATGDALAGKLSKTEAEAGFTEWECAPATYNSEPVVVAKITDGNTFIGYWGVFLKSATVRSEGTALVVPESNDDAATQLSWGASQTAWGEAVTAARTRLPTMADIPAASTATPQMDGTATAGSSAAFARGDHVHPSDTSRVAANAAITGATKCKVTYDAKGLVTGGADLEETDAPFVRYALPANATAIVAIGGAELSASAFPVVAGGTTYAASDVRIDSNGPYGWVLASASTSETLCIFDIDGKYESSPYNSITFNGSEPTSTSPVLTFYGSATMADRTGNRVAITAAIDELRLSFPDATSGKLRDFGLRVEVGNGSAALTAPALVPPAGVTLENADGAIPALADGTATAAGLTLLYFSETAPGVFLVKGEEVKGVS